MANLIEVEVWVLVDENGDYGIGKDEAGAVEAYESDVGALTEAGATRRIAVTLKVPQPQTVTLTGTVPAEGEAELAVA